MLINLNLDGSISKVTPEHIYQGSINVDKVEVMSQITEMASMLLIVTKVDGTVNEPILMDNSGFIDGYRVWSTNLDKSITNDKGNVKFTFKVYGSDKNILKTATLIIPIEESADEPLPEVPTPDIYNQILEELGKKQNANDDKLANVNKNVVDVINEHETKIGDLDNRVTQNTSDISSSNKTIQTNTQRIDALEQSQSTGIHFVGTMSGAEFPTSEQLTDFVVSQKGRQPKSGDLIRFTLVRENETDLAYDIYFSEGVWEQPAPIPVIEDADNDTYGKVKGSLGDTTRNTQTNINAGIIEDIRTKNLDGTYEDVALRENRIEQKQKDIINGTQVVENANSAKYDQLKDVPINEKYPLKQNVLTKTQADELYAPKDLVAIKYPTNQGLVDDVPTDTQAQFTVNTSNITPVTLFSIEDIVQNPYDLSPQNTCDLNLQMTSNINAVATFRFTFSLQKQDSTEWTDACIEVSNEIAFLPNIIQSVHIFAILNNLTGVFELEPNDKRRLKVEVIPKSSEANVWSMYCNEAKQSTFFLNAQSTSININYVGKPKEIIALDTDFVLNDESGLYEFTIPQTRHKQPTQKFYNVWASINNGGVEEKFDIDYSVQGSNIVIISTEAQSCTIYISSGVKSNAVGVKEFTNPTNIDSVDYNVIGNIVITQTVEQANNLSLKTPESTGINYSVYVVNDAESTFAINVNNLVIAPSNSVRFQWVGKWEPEQPFQTSDIEDSVREQSLDATLGDFETGILGSLVAKSEELKSGLDVNSVIEFFKYFYDLRKGNIGTWELEVGKGKNTNITDIFGFPYGELPNDPAEFIIKREATSGIGYTLKIIFTGEKSKTTHIGYVRGWIISGTSYDYTIHFTGWQNASGNKWVDDISQDITLNGTTQNNYTIGDLARPKSNQMIVKITKDGHSYNGNLLFDNDSQNQAESTIKLDNEDVYFAIDYTAKTFNISKTGSGNATITLHLFEQR